MRSADSRSEIPVSPRYRYLTKTSTLRGRLPRARQRLRNTQHLSIRIRPGWEKRGLRNFKDSRSSRGDVRVGISPPFLSPSLTLSSHGQPPKTREDAGVSATCKEEGSNKGASDNGQPAS